MRIMSFSVFFCIILLIPHSKTNNGDVRGTTGKLDNIVALSGLRGYPNFRDYTRKNSNLPFNTSVQNLDESPTGVEDGDEEDRQLVGRALNILSGLIIVVASVFLTAIILMALGWSPLVE